MSARSACTFALPLALSACAGERDPAGSSASWPDSTTSATNTPDLPPAVEPTSTSDDPASTTGTTDVDPGTSTSSTTGGPFCGDNVQDPGEECDYGRDNSNLGPCTLACTKATCGDGLVWEGVEQCDLGPANAKEYGGCTPSCEWAASCGDGNLDPGYEECDQGDLNGSGVEVDGVAPCTATCRWQGRLVFLSSATFTGDLGGVSGADLKCRALATAANLPNPQTFRAWLSDSAHSPVTRFKQIDAAEAPYILLNGRVVAASFGELVELGPSTGISVTETGEPLTNAPTWTNTDAFGEPFSALEHCGDWTSKSSQSTARLGLNAVPIEQGPQFDAWRDQRLWTSFLGQKCSFPNHLYCFEQ